MNRFTAALLAALLTFPVSESIAQSRIDFHLLPAVSSGPLDPDWSPDMQSLVFAARGDIWRIPVQGGRALALTSGPDYYSEPAFSPDGLRVAMTVYRGGDLDIAVVDAVSVCNNQ
jgi:Tol biopolymer transport system component